MSRTRSPTRTSASARRAATLAVVGWGSTYGPIHQAVRRCAQRGLDVAPRPHPPHRADAEKYGLSLLKGFERILVPEMNSGQLKTVLRDQFLVDAQPLTKVSGQPFRIAEIEAAIEEALAMKPINAVPLIDAC